MGANAVGSGTDDYMLITTSSHGYGNMDLAFRMRGSNTAAAKYQLQYSTDGINYSNFSSGTYKYSYTAYVTDGDGKSVQKPVSGEGKIQVELAQLKYRASRLAGLGKSLSRLGGGIGTRGPGEKKLEMDRRLIRERISRLKKELKDVERHRELIRGQRKQSGLKVAALVGYTSAGKSSIENALTQAGVLEDAMLFSTLDTTTRALTLDNTQEILLTDTVGFINKLPHHLVEAFKSTLEEAKYADIIVHVVDASNPQMDAQMHVVYETLRQLGAEGKPVITLFNKQDKVENPVNHKDLQADYSIATSAKTGQGLEEFKQALLEIIRKEQIYIERLYDFSEAGKIQLIRSKGQLLSEEYVPEGIEVKAYVPQDIYGRL